MYTDRIENNVDNPVNLTSNNNFYMLYFYVFRFFPSLSYEFTFK